MILLMCQTANIQNKCKVSSAESGACANIQEPSDEDVRFVGCCCTFVYAFVYQRSEQFNSIQEK